MAGEAAGSHGGEEISESLVLNPDMNLTVGSMAVESDIAKVHAMKFHGEGEGPEKGEEFFTPLSGVK
jgi:hypothetical protein